jgi:hypothetical protein
MNINDDMDPRKKALVDAMGGNTGIGGTPDVGALQAPPSLPSEPPVNGPPSPVASAAPGPFQSQNRSVRGYLDEAAKSYAPTIKGIGDEAGRKAAAQSYLQTLIPEVQARGGSMSDIRDEKATVDGRVLDFYRDIEGAADGQALDITDEARGGGGPAAMGMPSFAGSTINPMLQGNAQDGIQQALSGLTQRSPQLEELLAALSGGGQ